MVHCYKNNGYNIVLDSNSGSVHAVDRVAFDVIERYEQSDKSEIFSYILDKYPKVSKDDVEDIFSHIEELKKEGKLFSKDNFENLSLDLKNRKTYLKALCLHIAHDCNLCCKYCFAGEGEYSGDRSLMSFEVGKKALDFLIENSGSRKNLEVDFFGGEPLMNFKVVKDLVKYARSIEKQHNKNFRFTLTTNGILLDDEVMEWANKECYNVVLSLDGRKETNDRMRVSKNGKGSYDIILPKFLKMAESRNQEGYYIRGTYTRFNKDFSKDIIHMADLGFKQLAMEPVVSSPDTPYALQESDLPELLEQYDILAKEMYKRNKNNKGFTFFHYMIDLDAGPCIYKRISGCGVGSEYMAVTPTGDLYPCHQFVGDKKFLLGNVFEGVTNKEIIKEFKLCNVYSHEKCRDCFAKLYCSGGCTANAYHTTGDIKGTYDLGCELHKKRIECAIMLKVAQSIGSSNIENSTEN
ncbi:MAG: thioether cross-link-forming SCIFF peptide maturase [Acutalibacteraceae bacterium]